MKRSLWMLPSLALLLTLPAGGCGISLEGDEAGECSDGVDNDQDGRIDCSDTGCLVAADCAADDDDTVPDDDDASLDDDDVSPDDDDAGSDDDDAGPDDDDAGPDDDDDAGPDDDDAGPDDDDAGPDDDDDDDGSPEDCVGDFVIDGTDTMGDAVAVWNCTFINGSLTIEGISSPGVPPLTTLTLIEGDLTLRFNSATVACAQVLPALSWVTGDLTITDNSAPVGLPACPVSVSGDLDISENPALCQSEVNDFIASCASLGGVVQDISGNDEGC